MHDHRAIPFGLSQYSTKVIGIRPGDRCYSVARLFSALGFGLGFWGPLGLGATSVLSPRRPTVRAVLEIVGRQRVTVLTAVPTFWAQLAGFLEDRSAEGLLDSVRAARQGDAGPGVRSLAPLGRRAPRGRARILPLRRPGRRPVQGRRSVGQSGAGGGRAAGPRRGRGGRGGRYPRRPRPDAASRLR